MKSGRSIEERVRTTYRRLLIIEASLLAPADCSGDQKSLRAAVADMAWEASLDLKPLLKAPGEIANWVPPDPKESQ